MVKRQATDHKNNGFADHFFTQDGWWHTSSLILLGKPQLYTQAWNVKHKKDAQSSRSNIYNVLMVKKILCSLKTIDILGNNKSNDDFWEFCD